MGWSYRICAVSLCALAAACAATAPPQNEMTDAEPAVAAFDPATVAMRSASEYRAPEGVSFRYDSFTSEGVRLTAQWFHASDNAGKTLPTIIIAHGWGGTAANFRRDAIDLARAGYLVMLFDYRGWGESDGRIMTTAKGLPANAAEGPFVAEVKELRGYIDPWEQNEDWFNAISYAVTQPMVDADRIGIRGSSYSGGHVIYVAAHEPRVKAVVSQVSSLDSRPYAPYQPDPAAAIAQANASASRIAIGEEHYPEPGARAVGNLVGAPIGNKVARWAPIEHAPRVTQPVLFVLAENEELFSNTNNGILACERVSGPRQMVMTPGIAHYGIYGAERDLAIKTAIDWYDRWLKPEGSQTRIPVDRSTPERGACDAPFVRPPGVAAPAAAPARPG